jgi:Domain of unknown function (DUF1707)
VTTGPQDPAAAGRDRLRACHADREQVLETLKDAFVHGRLTKDELDTRAGRALAARTCAELDAVTADILPVPSTPATADLARPPTRPLVPARSRPLARAAARSGGCLAFAAAAVWASLILDPGGAGLERPWAGLMLFLAQCAVIAGVCILWSGAMTVVANRPRSGGLTSRSRAS